MSAGMLFFCYTEMLQDVVHRRLPFVFNSFMNYVDKGIEGLK